MRIALPLLVSLIYFGLKPALAQTPTLVTPAVHRLEAAEQRAKLEEQSLFAYWPFRNIGPSVQSGRVSDISVNPDDPSHFLVAYASGGLWQTTNNGTTFEPIFDGQAVLTTGAVAADWKRNVIWLGTGEVNSSRSSYAGLGMYRSLDGGQSWEHRGLAESHHIGRIILHPDDPNTLWVAVLGHLYSPNAERGIYKSTDGGESWQRVLFGNVNAGGIELVMDPRDPDHLYAALWERERYAWNFVESGDGSGIYESTNGGETWLKISGKGSRFPAGEGCGRIGLAMAYAGDTPVLYASLDNYDRRPAKAEDKDRLTKAALRTMTAADFAQVDNAQLNAYLRSNGFPKEMDAKAIKEKVASGDIAPLTLVEYTESANSLLFDTEVIGLEVYRLEGKKWRKTHQDFIDGVYYSYGYYFGQIRVNPNDAEQLYVLGVPVIRSDDGGANWRGINAANVHSDHHALWINPDRPGHLILGNDGGINISYDNGETYLKCNHPPLAQFYYIAVDLAEPYRVYGGLQDNGVWMGDHTYEASPRWQQSGHYGYKSIMGGDGMQVAIDPRDNETVYTGFQFGNYYRLNTTRGQRAYITPKHELGERPFRWNWQSPIHLSVHNPDILYMGSNFVHRSLDQGDNFTKISPDLTLGGQQGDVPYGTLTALHESPLRFGLLYAGSDDGLVHVSIDGGHQWQNISEGLPMDMWVSRIQASAHQEGRVYLTLNGYRWDHWNAMLYRSDDYGKTWTKLGRNLPDEPLNVVKEDPENAEVIYVGSDHGAYVSLDGGYEFMALANGLAAAPVHDLVVHPREGDLIVGTHGRSLYLGSAREIQQLSPEVLAESLHFFELEPVRHRNSWGRDSWSTADTEPEVKLPVYLREGGKVKLEVIAQDGPSLQTLQLEGQVGLQYLSYDLSIDPNQQAAYLEYLQQKLKSEDDPQPEVKAADNGQFYLQPGTYFLRLTKDSVTQEQPLEVK
jgi:photosystem II stability/assembly factor-like uncharacterized protein